MVRLVAATPTTVLPLARLRVFKKIFSQTPLPLFLLPVTFLQLKMTRTALMSAPKEL